MHVSERQDQRTRCRENREFLFLLLFVVNAIDSRFQHNHFIVKVNDATIREFRSLSDRISQSLRKSPSGTHRSIVVLNKQTSDYVDGRTANICDRWSRVQESLSRYAKLLEQAATIHEIISKIDGLLIQITNRKSKVRENSNFTVKFMFLTLFVTNGFELICLLGLNKR